MDEPSRGVASPIDCGALRPSCPQIDVFPVNLGSVNLGSVHLIDIGFASKQSLAGSMSVGKDWYLSSVTVLDLDTKVQTVFVADAWITTTKTRLQLQPYKPYAITAAAPATSPSTKVKLAPTKHRSASLLVCCRVIVQPAGGRSHHRQHKPFDSAEYEQHCSFPYCWFTARRFNTVAVFPVCPKARAPATQRYQISVSTGNKTNAGTDSDVSIVLVGETSSSPELRLTNNKKNLFEKGKASAPAMLLLLSQFFGTMGHWNGSADLRMQRCTLFVASAMHGSCAPSL